MLRKVHLNECNMQTNYAVITLAERCGPNLISLYLNDSARITDTAVIKIAQHCKGLTDWHLRGCYQQIDDTTLLALNRGCSQLQCVRLDADVVSGLSPAVVKVLDGKLKTVLKRTNKGSSRCFNMH